MTPNSVIRFHFNMKLTCNFRSDLILGSNLSLGSDLILVSNLFCKRDSQFISILRRRGLWPSLSSTPSAAHSNPNGFSL